MDDGRPSWMSIGDLDLLYVFIVTGGGGNLLTTMFRTRQTPNSVCNVQSADDVHVPPIARDGKSTVALGGSDAISFPCVTAKVYPDR